MYLVIGFEKDFFDFVKKQENISEFVWCNPSILNSLRGYNFQDIIFLESWELLFADMSINRLFRILMPLIRGENANRSTIEKMCLILNGIQEYSSKFCSILEQCVKV